MQCISCGSDLEPIWTHCPYCGKLKSVLKEPLTDENVENIFGKMMKGSKGKKDANTAAEYGSGVRGQVFEVIVRQAIAGAPWREICSGPMLVNRITVEEVEEEVQRRLSQGDPWSFKKGKDDGGKKGKSTKESTDEAKHSDDVKETGGLSGHKDRNDEKWSPQSPPRPGPFDASEEVKAASLRILDLYRQLQEFFDKTANNKDDKGAADKIAAELKDIANSVIRLEILLQTIRNQIAVSQDLERELRRTTKPFDPPEPPDDPHHPHRIDW